jgi:hypothetical protein
MAVAGVSFAESALGDLADIQAWYAEDGVPEDCLSPIPRRPRSKAALRLAGET